jgi:hypothetical protein
MTIEDPRAAGLARGVLTEAESHVLDYGDDALGVEECNLVVQELVARRLLRVETVDLRPRIAATTRSALYGDPRPTSSVAPSLVPTLCAYAAARCRPPRDGVPVADLAAAARTELKPLKRYYETYVVSPLVTRALTTVVARTGNWSDRSRSA